MEVSRHRYLDQYGYQCEVEIISDDIVVFKSTPNLCFDFKEHGIKIRRSQHYDYILRYVIKNEQLFLRGFETCLSRLCNESSIFGVKAETLNNGKWSIFHFDDIPVKYTGTLSIGKSFDYRYWRHDEKVSPVPFSPDVYKENGYLQLENGTIMEKVLTFREE